MRGKSIMRSINISCEVVLYWIEVNRWIILVNVRESSNSAYYSVVVSALKYCK